MPYFDIIEFPAPIDHDPVEITSFIDDRTGCTVWDVWSGGDDIAACSTMSEAYELANLYIEANI